MDFNFSESKFMKVCITFFNILISQILIRTEFSPDIETC